jgi:cytochrome c oxidase assembly protein subunit 15
MSWSSGVIATLTADPFLLHWAHRWWAWVAVGALVWLARRVKPHDRRAAIAVNAAIGTMVLLGIATVLSGVNLWLASAHQLVGALTVAATAWACHVDGIACQLRRRAT